MCIRDRYQEDDVFQAMEAFVYNLNSMHSRAGSQVPFSSVNLGCDLSEAGRMVTRCLLLAFEKGLGRGENPIFPNIIFRVKEGVNFNPGDPNYDLFRLAMRVASRRMNPTFSFMDASYNKPYGDEVAYMGCRTRVIGLSLIHIFQGLIVHTIAVCHNVQPYKVRRIKGCLLIS